MPYATNSDLPKRVREAMPAAAQSIFREVFNNVIEDEGTTEASAFAQAYGAVENAGYHQNTEGDWVKKKIEKFNPNHDNKGRFAPGSGSGGASGKISDFKSTTYAEDAMSKKYPDKNFDFSGADIETINPTVAEFDRLATKFPETAKSIKGIEVKSDLYMDLKTGSNGVYAGMTKSGDMVLNSKFYSRPESFSKQLASDGKNKWHPKGGDSFESIVTHEFAHQITNNISAGTDAEAKFALASIQGKLINKTTVTKQISKYAATNYSEAFAEAFVAYEHGGVRTGLAKQVGEFVYKYAK